MQEFRIKWQACPHVQHPTRVMFVEATDAETAKAVARDHIERTQGIEWLSIHECTPHLRPQNGKVVG